MQKVGTSVADKLTAAAVLGLLPVGAAALGGYGGSVLGAGVGGMTAADEREGVGRGYYRGGLLGAGLAGGAVAGGLAGTALGSQEYAHNIGTDDPVYRALLTAGVGTGIGALAGGAGGYALGRNLFGAPQNKATGSSGAHRATVAATGALGAAAAPSLTMAAIPPGLAYLFNDDAKRKGMSSRLNTGDIAGHTLPVVGGGMAGSLVGGGLAAAAGLGSPVATALGALAGGGLGAYGTHRLMGGLPESVQQMGAEYAAARDKARKHAPAEHKAASPAHKTAAAMQKQAVDLGPEVLIPLFSAMGGGLLGSTAGTAYGGMSAADEHEGMGRGYYHGGLIGTGAGLGAGLGAVASGWPEANSSLSAMPRSQAAKILLATGLGATLGGLGGYGIGESILGEPKNRPTGSSFPWRAAKVGLGTLGNLGPSGVSVVGPAVANGTNNMARQLGRPERVSGAEMEGHALPIYGAGGLGLIGGLAAAKALAPNNELATVLGLLSGGLLGVGTGMAFAGKDPPEYTAIHAAARKELEARSRQPREHEHADAHAA